MSPLSSPPGRAHILLVEDDDDIRETFAELLEEEGYSVATASDGREALIVLESGALLPDLILLDLMMPNMNGFQFREEQLKHPAYARIPVAVISADVMAKEKVEKLLVSRFIRKPVQLQPLLAVVESMIARPKAPPER